MCESGDIGRVTTGVGVGVGCVFQFGCYKINNKKNQKTKTSKIVLLMRLPLDVSCITIRSEAPPAAAERPRGSWILPARL